jgi:Fur family peroxide stress response transcriptional regulator
VERIADALRQGGYRATPQRLAVYQALLAREDHPCVEMIYADLQEAFPTISLNTVYNALQVLCDLGLVRKINIKENQHRYDANIHPHSHLVCLRCFRIINGPAVTNECPQADFEGFEAVACETYFYGYCKQCAEKSPCPNNGAKG